MNILVIVGWALILGAGILAGFGIITEGEARFPLLISAASLVIPGFIMMTRGKQVGRLVGASPRLLDTGLPGRGLITGLEETGISMGGIEDPVFKYTLQLSGDGFPATTAVVAQRTPRMLVGAILPGVEVAVRVDPSDPSEAVIDWSGQIVQGGGGGPTLDGVATRVTGVRSSADILRTGTRATGRVEQVRKLGELGQFADVPSNEADDPVFHMILTVTIPGRPPYQVETAQRFPDHVATRLTPGMEVPMAVDLDDPMDGVAIDLEALG